MNERPILFDDASVRVILDGSKTQTRRPIRQHRHVDAKCPMGEVGDALWVRECWGEVDFDSCHGMERDDFVWRVKPGEAQERSILYRATAPDFEWDERPESRWKPSIHMPRWASRLSLRVTSVRVERVRDITEADARAEGVPTPTVRCDQPIAGDGRGRSFVTHPHVAQFAVTWDGIYANAGWSANPWVWAITFEVVR